MARANDVLALARGELGTKEAPAGSNRVKYNAWYYGGEVSGGAYSWCMTFVQWCCAGAGVSLPLRTASCGALMRAAQRTGQWVTEDFRPGDVAIYNFPGGAATDHTGIVERVSDAGVIAIEGNTALGNDSNGGMVLRRSRAKIYILGAVRPRYEEDDTMTQEQFDGMMDNWMGRRAALDPGDFSAQARAWAEGSGIVLGDGGGRYQYKSYCTREQMLVFLQRFAKTLEK